MSEPSPLPVDELPRTRDRVAANLSRRYARERAFRLLGLGALLFGLGFLAIFFVTLAANGASALLQTRILLDVELDPEVVDPDGGRDPSALETANYQQLIRDALNRLFPEVTDRAERRALYRLLSPAADLEVREIVLENPGVIGETLSLWLLADDDVDMLMKGYIDRGVPEAERRLSDAQIRWNGAVGDHRR